jgi:hypothetical protein
MPLYMYQAAYTAESWAAQMNNPVCTENPIRVNRMIESVKLARDRADLLRSGRAGLAIQVEHPA